mmetsp:Transcript_5434/g.15997  ORF Transcript_5434/g.15997 Transcript_5434/m.15997 type:complete len:204 (+) Transcript_5434:271-882(+)
MVHLEHILREAENCLVPVVLGLFIEVAVDERQKFRGVLSRQAALGAEGFVVPQEEGSLDDLEMLRREAGRDKFEELSLDLLELFFLQQFQDLLEFVDKQDLLGGRAPGPVLEEPCEDRHCSGGVLLHVLDNAVRELLVVEADTLGHMKRDEGALEELEVLFLERDGKAVDDRPQDLQELADAIVLLGLINKAVEYIGNGLADE